MDRLPPILLLIVLFAVILAAMRWGWRARARRQAQPRSGTGLPAPAPLGPGRADDRVLLRADGLYVSTTLAAEHLERITAHGLGMGARAQLLRIAASDPAQDRWEVRRTGAPSFTIPVASLTASLTAPGMAGRWIGGEALVLLRWQLGEHELDTGLRLERREDHEAAVRLAAADASRAAGPSARPDPTPAASLDREENAP